MIKLKITHTDRHRQIDGLTDCDIVEPVEWFVGCCDCHSYSVFSLTAIKGLEEGVMCSIAKEWLTL